MADEGGSAFARDPMMQKWWTLPMALAWGLWKAPEMVDWAWHVSAAAHGHSRPLTLSRVLWRFRYDESERNTYIQGRGGKRQEYAEAQARSALDHLTDALENARIRAEGTEPSTEIRRAIGSEDWRKAELGSLHLNSDLPEHDALYVKRSHTPILLGVRVLREDVVREFGDAAVQADPAPGAPPAPVKADGPPAAEVAMLAGPDPIISAPEQKGENAPTKPKRVGKRVMDAAAKARNDGRAKQIATRERTLRRLLAERPEMSVTQGEEALKAELGPDFPASRGTVQAAMAAIKAERVEKKRPC